jgi:hypothetical protein
LRGRLRPRRLIEMVGRGNIKIKKLRVSNGNAAGNCVFRILILNDIITCTIIADIKRVADYRRRRRYGMISSSESEKLIAVSLFFN